MTHNPSDQALGLYLQSLRKAAGLDPAVLARRLSLSTAQLIQLEEGEHSLFYTPGIRMQAARKCLIHLGGDLARLEAAPAAELSPTPPAPQALQPPKDLNARLISPATEPPEPEPQALATAPAARRPASRVLVGGLMLSALLFALAYLAGRSAPPQTAPVLSGAQPVPDTPSQASASTPTQLAQAQPAAPVAAAQTPEPAPAAAAPAPSLTCQPPTVDATEIRPPQARKPGDMVYVVSRVEQVVCVTDGNGQQQLRPLKAGQGLSFSGPPPWQLQSSQWAQTQLYFQGWRVRLPAGAGEVIRLVELQDLEETP